MQQLSVADVLSKAADLLTPEGAWAQGMYGMYRGSRCMCAVGAIGNVRKSESILLTKEWIADNALRPMRFDTVDQLEEWNDHPSRTQGEVVAALRAAAELAKASS